MNKKTLLATTLTLLLASMPFLAIPPARCDQVVHDLQATLERLASKDHLTSGKTMIVNMTVRNIGTFAETNVTLQFLINGKMRVNTFIDELRQGKSFSCNYSWTPSEDAVFNLTVYVFPVLEETSLGNNMNTSLVKVCNDMPPLAIFTFSPKLAEPNVIELSKTIHFDASLSNDPDWGPIRWYNWNFGDGESLNLTSKTTSHPFQRISNFTVTLTLGDKEGRNNSTQKTLLVDKIPKPRFKVSNPSTCKPPLDKEPYFVNRTLSFDASDTIPGYAPVVRFLWNFGDGDVFELPKVTSHTYHGINVYNVTLTVTDSYGAYNSTTKPTNVTVGYPTASFSVSPQPCSVNVDLTFNASASYDPDNYNSTNHGIVRYIWHFGDGDYSENASSITHHTYIGTGSMNVNLTTIDSDRHYTSKLSQITVSKHVSVNIEPTSISRNPGELFTINITVSNVENLGKFNLNVTWSASVLECIDAQLGPFLGSPGNVNFTRYFPSGRGYAQMSANRRILGGVSGNGTLAVLTLKSMCPGNTTLQMPLCSLINTTQAYIPHGISNGSFYTTVPVATFTWSPPNPPPNNPVTFDASKSYDPDSPGPLSSYLWNFGDGNETQNSSPIIIHPYSSPGTYNVTLTVTDDDNRNSTTHNSLIVSSGRDAAIVNMWSPCNETAGKLPINVTIRNEGNMSEKVPLTLFYSNATGNYTIESKTEPNLNGHSSKMLSFTWDIKNVTKGFYVVYAWITPLLGEVNLLDNVRNCTITVWLQGDIDRDNKTGILDVVKITGKYGNTGPRCWDPADLNCDGAINIFDIVICTTNYGKSDP